VLLAAEGVPNRQIAPMVGMNEHTVAQWRRRFAAEGLAGLQDRQRPGRPLVYDHDQRLRIVATVTQQPPHPASHWSHSQLAKALADMGISASQIGRILADLDLKPHRVRSWITRPDDPGFWERAADICGLYLVPPTNALVLSVDEKTGMPARSRTRPTSRPAPGRPTRQEHEYMRHGTAIRPRCQLLGRRARVGGCMERSGVLVMEVQDGVAVGCGAYRGVGDQRCRLQAESSAGRRDR
jgi:transposase